jgi:hypothetical protein
MAKLRDSYGLGISLYFGTLILIVVYFSIIVLSYGVYLTLLAYKNCEEDSENECIYFLSLPIIKESALYLTLKD